MALRGPRNLFGMQGADNVDVLQYEILQEKIAVLGRLGRKLQTAMDALHAFDAQPGPAAERDALVGAAGEALWYYVIQREVMGLDTEAIFRELRIPREVRLRMGLNRRAPDRSHPL